MQGKVTDGGTECSSSEVSGTFKALKGLASLGDLNKVGLGSGRGGGSTDRFLNRLTGDGFFNLVQLGMVLKSKGR